MTNPTPVKRESRFCFGIKWFATEEEAMAYHCNHRRSARQSTAPSALIFTTSATRQSISMTSSTSCERSGTTTETPSTSCRRSRGSFGNELRRTTSRIPTRWDAGYEAGIDRYHMLVQASAWVIDTWGDKTLSEAEQALDKALKQLIDRGLRPERHGRAAEMTKRRPPPPVRLTPAQRRVLTMIKRDDTTGDRSRWPGRVFRRGWKPAHSTRW